MNPAQNLILITQGRRGLWLAQEAAKRNHQVYIFLLEETESDVDHGPFGLLRGAAAEAPSQEAVEHWQSQWACHRMGLLTSQGSWTFETELLRHRGQRAGMVPEAIGFASSGVSQAERAQMSDLRRHPFQETWLAALVADLPRLRRTSAVGRYQPEAFDGWSGGASLAPVSELRLGKDGLLDSLNHWRQRTDPERVQISELRSLSFDVEGDGVKRVRANGEGLELGLAVSLVSQTRLEAAVADQSSALWRWVPRLAETERKASTLRWWSCLAELGGNEKLIEVLPTWLAIANDLEIPWTEDNLLIVHRDSPSSRKCRLWLRSELQPARDRSDWVGLVSRLDDLFAARCPGVALQAPRAVESYSPGPFLRETAARQVLTSSLQESGRFLQLGPETWNAWTWSEMLRAESTALRAMI